MIKTRRQCHWSQEPAAMIKTLVGLGDEILLSYISGII